MKNRFRRVCATLIVVMVTVSMTGCSADEFFGAILFSLACASSAEGPEHCFSFLMPDSTPPNPPASSSAATCQVRSQTRELAAQQCSNQQDQWQIATTPGALQDPLRCRLSANALADSSGNSCPADGGGGH
jgi:hypothetical protein